MSPSCVPGAFLLELLPSEVTGVDVGHVAEVISSNWYSSISPWHRSSSSACQHLSQKMAPWTYIHVPALHPCPTPALLTTIPTVPHWNTALCSQFQLPQCRGCSGLLLLLVVVLVRQRPGAWSSGCSPHILPTAPRVPLGHQARLSQLAGTPLCPEATLCSDINHLLWGT